MDSNTRIRRSWNALRYSYGIVLLVIGLDKILGTEFIVHWPQYVSPFAESLLPVSVNAFLIIIGIVEDAVAVLMLTKWTRIAAHLSIAWLVLIAINLLLAGFVDVAARDLLLAVGAYVMAELSLAAGTPRDA